MMLPTTEKASAVLGKDEETPILLLKFAVTAHRKSSFNVVKG
jgi:hypothetical protein